MKSESDNLEDETERILNKSVKAEADLSQNFEPKHNCMLMAILGLIFFSFCVDTILFPFFPTIARQKGLSPTEIGIVFAVFDLTRFITAPVVGSLDRLTTNRKYYRGPTSVWDLGLWVLCSWLLLRNFLKLLLVAWFRPSVACSTQQLTLGQPEVLLVTTLSNEPRMFLSICLVIRGAAGVGSAMLNVSGTSILMKASGYESASIVGFVETVNMCGYSVGPAIGAALFQLIGYTPMFCALGATLLLIFPIYGFLVPKVEETETARKHSFCSVCRIPGIFLMFLSWTFLKLSSTSRTTQISSFFMSKFDVSASAVGLLFAVWSVISIASSLTLAKFFNKKYSLYLLLFTWIIEVPFVLMTVPSFPFTYLTSGESHFWLTFGGMSGLSWLTMPLYVTPFPVALQLARLNGHTEDSLQTYGMLTGLMNCGLCLGSTIGPILSGVITSYLGFAWTQFIAAILTAFMATLIAVYLAYLICTNQLSAMVGEEKTTTEAMFVEFTLHSFYLVPLNFAQCPLPLKFRIQPQSGIFLQNTLSPFKGTPFYQRQC
ncbi:MFS-type transporter SLC18B1-like [Watersipora subatra]|uniref:MFS-type transporter SLC18B1-like n=1 Tax=Watersipora subatra TaxID=2589382 RepID=UPI00355C7111